MDKVFLRDMTVLAGLAVAVVAVLVRLRLPTMAGLIVAGAIAGPGCLGLVRNQAFLERLADIGVALLLFTVGLDFSFRRLSRIAKVTVVGGALQVLMTSASVAVGATLLFAESLGKAVFLGFIIALSSTAIVLKILMDKGEADCPHGRFIVGVLIFQDLVAVFMMLMVPVLGGSGSETQLVLEMTEALVKAAMIVIGTVVMARSLLPKLFRFITAPRSRELFLLAVVVVLLLTTWVSAAAGLSVALGAFLGGLMLADTEFKHRALGEMIPFRDLLTSLFFLSLGMFADFSAVTKRPLEVAALTVFLLFGKAVFAVLAALLMRFPARVALVAGAGLAQFSEFGFVLLRFGQKQGLVSNEEAQILIVAGLVSMLVTPLVMAVAPHFSAGQKVLRPLERLLGARGIDEVSPSTKMTGHVVVVGYGVAGRTLAKALARTGVPYVVLELNPETVRVASAAGENIYYADATHQEALRHAGLPNASALVLVINDPGAAERIVAVARECAPGVPVFVRTRFLADLEFLKGLGASHVVIDEVVAGLEVTAKVLGYLGLDKPQIDDAVTRGYEAMTKELGN